jgi:proline dehydrogenase
MNPENLSKSLPDFTDTAEAFAHLSDKDLKWAIRLFSAFKYPALVKYGPGLANFAMKLRLPVKGIIRNTLFRHFCGGESIDDSSSTIDMLFKYGVKTILDYSVEGEEDEKVFDETRNEIKRTIDKAYQNPAIPFAVFKVTGVAKFTILKKVSEGKDLSEDENIAYLKVVQRVEDICSYAAQKGVCVMIDAEESWIQPAIDSLAISMSQQFNIENVIVFNTLQMYRHDRLEFLKSCFQQFDFPLGFKLVRGAYMEKERMRALELNYASPIQPNKAATDSDYNQAVALCLENIHRCRVVVGTHNEQSCLLAAKKMLLLNLEPDDIRVYFSQLLGMSDNISFNLAKNGFNVAKYVPYGPVEAVLPYLSRRAEENSSVKGQSSRELLLLEKEKQRRKSH